MYTAEGKLDMDSAIEQYAPMVKRVANQLAGRLPPNVDIGDLVQSGMMGLMDAMTRFDKDAGAQFETFATQRVRGAMLDELRGTDWLPRSARRAQRTIEQAVTRLQQKLMRTPGEHEIATELGLSVPAYQKMLGDARGSQLFYLDDLNGPDGQDSFLERHEPDEPENFLNILRDDRFRGSLEKAITALPEREQMIMGMYYEQDMNLKEIGAVLGVTESRISQLHSQAVSRLRTRLEPWT